MSTVSPTTSTYHNKGLHITKQHRWLHRMRPWAMWVVGLCFILFQFSLQLSGGVMVNQLMHSFTISALGASLLTSSYYYIYVLLQIPAGMLVDKLRPRRLLTFSALICSIGCLVYSHAHEFAFAELGELLMGAGTSMAFISTLYLVGKWFPPHRYALMVGMTEMAGVFGAILADITLAHVVSTFGWRNGIFAAAGIAAIISLLCWTIIRDAPRHELKHPKPFDGKAFISNVGKLLANPKAWFNGIYTGVMFSLITVFVALWGIPYMAISHQLSLMQATMVCTMMMVGLSAGCPLMGWLCGRLHRRRPILVANALICALLMAIVIYCPAINVYVDAVLLFMTGFFSSVYVFNYTIGYEMAPVNAKSTSIGFVNTLGVITAPVFQPIVGLILYLIARGHAHQIYTVLDYQIALTLLPACLIIAAILAIFIPETNK